MRSLDELATEICTLAGHINAANHRFLRSSPSSTGARGGPTAPRNPALTGSTGNAASPWAPRARKCAWPARSRTLPRIAAAMASGSLSYSKAREITRIGIAGKRGIPSEHRRARHRRSRRAPRARVSPLPGGRGTLARAAAATEPQSQLPLRRRWLTRPHLPPSGRGRRQGHEGAGCGGGRSAGLRGRSRWNVQSKSCPTASAAPMLLRASPKVSWRTTCSNLPARIASRSSCTSPPRRCARATAGCCEIEHGPSIPAETARRIRL